MIYFGTGFGGLFAFSEDCATEACEPAWSKKLPNGIASTPAVVDGVLYVGTVGFMGRFYAFDVDDCASGSCEPLWTSDGRRVHVLADGVRRASSTSGPRRPGSSRSTPTDAAEPVCDPLWIGETDGAVLNSPAVAKGVVYVGSASGDLLAFDADGCGAATCEPLVDRPGQRTDPRRLARGVEGQRVRHLVRAGAEQLPLRVRRRRGAGRPCAARSGAGSAATGSTRHRRSRTARCSSGPGTAGCWRTRHAGAGTRRASRAGSTTARDRTPPWTRRR